MAEIIRNRTIRPSSRLESSKSYKINTKGVNRFDTLIVHIDHETKPFQQKYSFEGRDVADCDSIHFRVREHGNQIDITWSGAQPIGGDSDTPQSQPRTQSVQRYSQPRHIERLPVSEKNFKQSLTPIGEKNAKVLILGTMPGEESLRLQEYYANPRNRFWKIIAAIFNEILPDHYEDRKKILLKHNIAIWDVAGSAEREGSLDSAIRQVVPNDIDEFLDSHKYIRLVCFNGQKAAKLYEKYCNRHPELRYATLPSTSPANTGITWEKLLVEWRVISE